MGIKLTYLLEVHVVVHLVEVHLEHYHLVELDLVLAVVEV
jgi:hypothetical protein